MAGKLNVLTLVILYASKLVPLASTINRAADSQKATTIEKKATAKEEQGRHSIRMDKGVAVQKGTNAPLATLEEIAANRAVRGKTTAGLATIV